MIKIIDDFRFIIQIEKDHSTLFYIQQSAKLNFQKIKL